MKFKLSLILCFSLLLCSCVKKEVTLETLLDEMVNINQATQLPDVNYTCKQISSYDRRTVSPDSAGWFANNDGFGIVRKDTVGDVVQHVMMDQEGPGAITRMWITTSDKTGTLKFYFDGAEQPQWELSGYDFMNSNLPINGTLALAHTHYKQDVNKTGGNTLYLPIPYAKHCKVVLECPVSMPPTPHYYQINYRTYEDGTKVKTFSPKDAKKLSSKIETVCKTLTNPDFSLSADALSSTGKLEAQQEITLSLPDGEHAITKLELNVKPTIDSLYGQIMRNLILQITFDGKQTVWVPLSDFSGGGMGAPMVQSWYLASDGKGKVSSRWLMPYSKNAELKVINTGRHSADVTVKVDTKEEKWTRQSLYFHTSWRQQRGIYVHNRPDEQDKCIEWNFITLKGRGVYMGDLLSLYNHAPLWYGEGDEKIWVDDDTTPSHIGTGTEDYYNCSWAPVIVFNTPFGGAPRSDNPSSHGYNAFFRTRNLDGIPFNKQLKFDIEMLSWEAGTVDYATTVYWYGDAEAQAIGTSGIEEASIELLPSSMAGADYKHFME